MLMDMSAPLLANIAMQLLQAVVAWNGVHT
jgi:hypothetical protein